MRILVMTNLYPNPYDPTRATFNRQQVRALAEEHEVRVISPISWIDELKARSSGQPPLPPDRRIRCDGLIVYHPRYLYSPKVLRRAYGQCYCHSVRATFKRALREFAPAIVLAPWAYPDGWAAVRLGHEAGLPVVIKVHGCDIRQTPYSASSRLGPTRDAVRTAEGIIAVSRDLADTCVRLGAAPENVHLVYDGVNAQWFHPGSRTEARASVGLADTRPLILTVAALVPVKGLDVLIDACARLRDRGRAFQCRIIGKGPLAGDLKAQVARLNLAHHVVLHGAAPHESLGNWYRAANIFALPSHSEGTPCVLLEAMATGLPFVASHVGGIPEVAPKGGGQLVPPGRPDALADALEAELLNSRVVPLLAPRSHADAARELAAALGLYVTAQSSSEPQSSRPLRAGASAKS